MTKPLKHFHFVGIGGIGMGAIACLLVAKGCRVSGSDVKESELTMKLRELGATVIIGHSTNNIRNPDFVVYSSAIDKDNPELMCARQRRIPVFQRAQVLAQLMQDQKGITIAGAHGKTTTTSMISYLLIKAGLHPTTAVGGIVSGVANGGAYNASLGEGKYFVAEVDESDGSFLYFSPFYSIVTNIDFEHVDYYGNWDNILKAYRQFIGKTHPQGHIFGCGDDARLQALLKEGQRPFTTYGFGEQNDVSVQNIISQGYFSSFDCFYRGTHLGQITLHVPGRHNVLNSLACIALAKELGIDFNIIKEGLSEFSGAKRRFQLKGEVRDITVIDDYGHHPTEILATLEAAKSFGKKRVIVAFQPHRYTRTKFLMDEFIGCFKACDYLIVTDIYAASEQVIFGVSAEGLVEKIKVMSGAAAIYLKKEEILPHLLKVVKSGDLVLTLGAGDITRLSDDLVRELKEEYKTTQEPLLPIRPSRLWQD